MIEGRASIWAGERAVVSNANVRAEGGVVLAVMGPGGSGKSALLRVLAGVAPRAGLRVTGTITVGGMSAADARGAGRSSYLPQSGHPLPDDLAQPDSAEAALEAAPYVLLDEPPVTDALGRHLRGHAGVVVLVTHHQAFARAWCDRVLFMRVGEVEPIIGTEDFFSAPPSPLATQFVGRGTCAPEMPALELPSHFYWLLPQRLAGMGLPGLQRDADEDLASMAEAGVRAVVNLTETPMPSGQLSSHGLASLHVPIKDMGIPSYQAAASACRFVDEQLARDAPVALHCRAGLGRTGTMLACHLVWSGAGGREAIERVRTAQRHAIQTPGQERFVEAFARRYGTG